MAKYFIVLSHYNLKAGCVTINSIALEKQVGKSQNVNVYYLGF